MLQAIRAKEEQLSNQRHVLETLTGLEDQVGAAGWCAAMLCTCPAALRAAMPEGVVSHCSSCTLTRMP